MRKVTFVSLLLQVSEQMEGIIVMCSAVAFASLMSIRASLIDACWSVIMQFGCFPLCISKKLTKRRTKDYFVSLAIKHQPNTTISRFDPIPQKTPNPHCRFFDADRFFNRLHVKSKNIESPHF